MIQLTNVTLMRGGLPLFSGADLRVAPGEKAAVIGPNGAGKSSLFQLLLGALQADEGQVSIPAQWHIAHMHQETPGLERSAVDFVLDGLTEWREVQAALVKAETDDDIDALVRLHGRMDDMEGYQVQHEAEIILLGLGFETTDLERPVSDFSGGWRVRLNLAQTLIQRSDLLLLDEPTNHLDLETVDWLQSWLLAYQGTLLLISHDRDFLDAVANRVISFEQGELQAYSGNYSQYERQRAERRAQQQVEFDKQQARKSEMEQFVARFRYQANKAKQAQSRLKALEKMTLTAPARADSPFTFRFSAGDKVSSPLIALREVSLGYGDLNVLSGLKLNLYPGMRIGLLGKNGAGKSTLIKHLSGTLPAQSGDSTTGMHYYPGYFAQHQVDALDDEASPLLHLQRLAPTAREQKLRNFLGGFNFSGDMVITPVAPFSGGEKARLALALLAWENPNVLLLDEPTNHLDLTMRAALAEALQAYSGAVIVVSHDRFLMESTVDEFWLVADGTVQPYDGDLAQYLAELKAPREKPSSPAGDSENNDAKREAAGKTATPSTVSNDSRAGTKVESSSDNPDRKADRRVSAQARKQLSPLKKQARQAASRVESCQAKIDEINQSLTDASLYEADRKTDLQTLLGEQASAQQALEAAEADWMAAEEKLETAQQTAT